VGLASGQLMIQPLLTLTENVVPDLRLPPLTFTSKPTAVTWGPNPTEKVICVSYLGSEQGLGGFMVKHLERNVAALVSEFQKESVWTSSWSYYNPALVSAGLSGRATVMDITTQKQTDIFTHKSDVFSQYFSKQGPILFNGCRNGGVIEQDLRSFTAANYFSPSKYSLLRMKLLNNGLYLLCSTSAEGMLLWDLRMRKKLISYEEDNEFTEGSGFSCFDTDFANEHLYYTNGKKLKLYEIYTGKCLREIKLKDEIYTLASVSGGRMDSEEGIWTTKLSALTFYSGCSISKSVYL